MYNTRNRRMNNRIGLIDVDGHGKFPNLPLMKLSAYHKAIGDSVEFVDYMFGNYDRVYMSKVFSFTDDCLYPLTSAEVVKAGTGYLDYVTTLSPEIEHICPHYELYPGTDYAIGFTTRGCPNRCRWCIVPQKEGFITAHSEVDEFLGNHSKAVLLDNNILASQHGITQIEKCICKGIRIDINQGLDARILSGDAALLDLLARTKWIEYIRMACDTPTQLAHVETCIRELHKRGISPGRIFVYTLIEQFDDSLERITRLRDLGCSPFGQPYMDFEKSRTRQWQRDMARWCNIKSHLHGCEFSEYRPRKGFSCKNYFTNRQLLEH